MMQNKTAEIKVRRKAGVEIKRVRLAFDRSHSDLDSSNMAD